MAKVHYKTVTPPTVFGCSNAYGGNSSSIVAQVTCGNCKKAPSFLLAKKGVKAVIAAAKAIKPPTGPTRSWEIQYEPQGALPALALRYLSLTKAITLNKLFQMVWDDLVECAFWTREKLPDAHGKVFVHAMGGMSRTDDRRRTIKGDLKAALTMLVKALIVVSITGESYQLRTVKARADWLAAQPITVINLYRSLRMTHDGWEGARAGLERFDNVGALKDPRDEEIRQLKLERNRLKIELEEAKGMLKIRRDASEKRRQLVTGRR